MTASLERIDSYPTHRIAGLPVRAGNPLLLGASFVPGGVNFAVHSESARQVELLLYRRGAPEPYAALLIPASFRTGSVHAIVVYDLDELDTLEYAFRVDGGAPLADPYAKLVSGREVWGEQPDWEAPYPYRSRLLFCDFDWGDDVPPGLPMDELVIYELHVRGFTRHPSSGVSAPGTYAGLREKIPYLRELGVNAIELMPVFEFDEFENSRVHDGERLYNFWGYSTISFFAPKAGYAASGRYGMAADEFKALVRECHANGIEVILDVVFNHTAEGNEHGPAISFKGLDNQIWYMLTPEGYYYNFSGTGNTLNCNHPVVREFVLDCLRYWVSEYRIDGFRFDLAAILSRDVDGTPLPNPPLLQTLAHDPVLRRCKLIAEAWDAAGLYEVGSFPDYQRWSEWNGRYRDALRAFVKGDPGAQREMAGRYIGSPDLYSSRGTYASVNFVTAHDGFTLRDLVTYNGKHNQANGEDGRDGGDDNQSWNCGVEGESTDPEVVALRRRQMKNLLTMLLTSQGVPMILAGDERARTQRGNNNAYCHDSELTWVDWTPDEFGDELIAFTAALIAFRKAHPAVRVAKHPTDKEFGAGLREVSWHGERPWQADWSDDARLLAVIRCAPFSPDPGADLDCVFVAANTHWQARQVEPPALPTGVEWRLAVDTFDPGAELTDQNRITVRERSTVVLHARVPAALLDELQR
jgi:isoamylase